MPKLDIRLQAIFNEINDVKTIVDVGCDHGKLIVQAILLGKAEKGIAIDISPYSLKKAQILAKEYNVDEKIDFFVGDGFAPIQDKVSIAVIAGMGAREIVKIISSKQDIAEKYIFVPHQDAHILRRYLKEKNDYKIVKDYIIYEQKYYPIIVAQKGINDYTDEEIFLGKNLPKSDFYEKWIAMRFKKIKNIIDKAGKNAMDDDLIKEWEVLNNGKIIGCV
ncbi:MAG TPA: class I SAM-dependent methyltransferase [Clostridia bacterium]|nr:class I SAM-dependent methyltransferase [Clostridia bacterium]